MDSTTSTNIDKNILLKEERQLPKPAEKRKENTTPKEKFAPTSVPSKGKIRPQIVDMNFPLFPPLYKS